MSSLETVNNNKRRQLVQNHGECQHFKVQEVEKELLHEKRFRQN